MADMPKPQTPAEASANLATCLAGLAENAAHVAHACRRHYLAYIDEGFTEPQALELCKVLTL